MVLQKTADFLWIDLSHALYFYSSGNYDEGFGREQRKADWVKKEKNENVTNADAESASVEGVQDGE